MPAFFVTATGTEVGKTFVSRGLIGAGRRAGCSMAALKPIASGFDEADLAASDTAALLDALGEPVTPVTVSRMSPWRFAAPLSPDMAARLEGRTVAFPAVVALCRAASRDRATTIIEGIGGVMVPLGGGRTVLDLLAAVGGAVVLVSPTGLGAISHLLTALEALKSHGVGPITTVLSETAGSTVPLDLLMATLHDHGVDDPIVLRRSIELDQHEAFDALFARLSRL